MLTQVVLLQVCIYLAREAEPRTVLPRLTCLTWTTVLASDYDFRFDLLSVAYDIMAVMHRKYS